MVVYLKIQHRIEFDYSIDTVRIFQLKPYTVAVDLFGVDLQVVGLIGTDSDALFGKELGALFGPDRDVDDNAGCHQIKAASSADYIRIKRLSMPFYGCSWHNTRSGKEKDNQRPRTARRTGTCHESSHPAARFCLQRQVVFAGRLGRGQGRVRTPSARERHPPGKGIEGPKSD